MGHGPGVAPASTAISKAVRRGPPSPRSGSLGVVRPCSVLPGVPSPPEMPWWRRCGPAPSSTPAGSREVVGSGCGSSRTCARPRDTSGPWFRAGRLGAGEKLRGTLGVDGWAPYRCFKEATLQTCYNHLLHRCHELLETATRGAVRFPRLVKAILQHALARDRRDAGEISPHGLRVAKGLLQAKMNRLLHGRFTNPANQRFAKHLRRYRDNLFVFLACGPL